MNFAIWQINCSECSILRARSRSERAGYNIAAPDPFCKDPHMRCASHAQWNRCERGESFSTLGNLSVSLFICKCSSDCLRPCQIIFVSVIHYSKPNASRLCIPNPPTPPPPKIKEKIISSKWPCFLLYHIILLTRNFLEEIALILILSSSDP